MYTKVFNRLFPNHQDHAKSQINDHNRVSVHWNCSCGAMLKCPIATWNKNWNILSLQGQGEAAMPNVNVVDALQQLNTAVQEYIYNIDVAIDTGPAPANNNSYAFRAVPLVPAAGFNFKWNHSKKITDTTEPEIDEKKQRTERRRNGLCLKCGDKGSMINMVKFCNKMHGEIRG